MANGHTMQYDDEPRWYLGHALRSRSRSPCRKDDFFKDFLQFLCSKQRQVASFPISLDFKWNRPSNNLAKCENNKNFSLHCSKSRRKSGGGEAEEDTGESEDPSQSTDITELDSSQITEEKLLSLKEQEYLAPTRIKSHLQGKGRNIWVVSLENMPGYFCRCHHGHTNRRTGGRCQR